MMNYITNYDTIMFSPSFNDVLDPGLLSKYKKIIFSDYDFTNDSDLMEILFNRYKNNDFEIFGNENGLKFNESMFNQPVNHLPSHITHLTFGTDFNQPVPNLPSLLIY